MNATRHSRDTDEEGIKAQAPQNSKGPTFAMERATAPWAIAGLGRLGGLGFAGPGPAEESPYPRRTPRNVLCQPHQP